MTKKIALQHIYKFSETKECEVYFNKLVGNYKHFESIGEATAAIAHKKEFINCTLTDSKDLYMTNISVVREYNDNVLINKFIYSHTN